MDDGDAASARQFRWPPADGVQRPVRVQRAGRAARLCDANRYDRCCSALDNLWQVSLQLLVSAIPELPWAGTAAHLPLRPAATGTTARVTSTCVCGAPAWEWPWGSSAL